ncbi:hypothetical protein K1719_027471 [Acacia pycnantha]|nr:hypothetical protein K1719_027471 [Acacia pycnantha]
MELQFDEKDFFTCCGSTRFAKEMVLASPFSSLQDAISTARDIWFNKVDVNGWLEAFSVNFLIGEHRASAPATDLMAQWSKCEQSTALSTAKDCTSQELEEWNASYREKFGFIFMICATGRSTDEILAELKRRYQNRPLVELENAAQEQIKITELRLARLFSSAANGSSTTHKSPPTVEAEKAQDTIDGLVNAASKVLIGELVQGHTRTRPPITTHVLDVSRGSPATGVEVLLEKWADTQSRPTFKGADSSSWVVQGSSTTDSDGRSGQLMSIVDDIDPGIYRISFDTEKYNPNCFFPYVSIVFEVQQSQTKQHFHVPLLLSPYSFSTYRGS